MPPPYPLVPPPLEPSDSSSKIWANTAWRKAREVAVVWTNECYWKASWRQSDERYRYFGERPVEGGTMAATVKCQKDGIRGGRWDKRVWRFKMRLLLVFISWLCFWGLLSSTFIRVPNTMITHARAMTIRTRQCVRITASRGRGGGLRVERHGAAGAETWYVFYGPLMLSIVWYSGIVSS